MFKEEFKTSQDHINFILYLDTLLRDLYVDN